MSSLQDTPSANEGVQAWRTAIKNAFLRQYRAEQLQDPFRELKRRYQVAPRDIADVLLAHRASRRHQADDALLFRYAEMLVRQEIIDMSHLLLALLRHSRYSPEYAASHGDGGTGLPVPSCEERMFILISQMLAASDFPQSALKVHQLLFAVTCWLHATTKYEMAKRLESGGLHTLDAIMYGLYETLGTLAITVLSNPSLRQLPRQEWWKKRRDVIVNTMEQFDAQLLQWMQSQLAGRLRALAGLPPYIALDSQGRPQFTLDQVMGMIPDVPAVHSRAGLFIWLDAALCSRPLTDDMATLAYLHGRYPDDIQSMVVDFLVAAFDVLTNALLRKDPSQHVKVIRSFICNKVPVLLTMLSSIIVSPITIEAMLQVAFMPTSMITMEPLAPLTPGATEIRDILKQTRLEFLQACALHNLVTDVFIASIVQDPTYVLPRATKYTKEALVTQCNHDLSRIEGLMDELNHMHGNAGAISGCIVETLGNLCLSKDTTALASLCQMLNQRIPLLDIMMQYMRPSMILIPLCTQLNDWVHDQDQAEFAPEYEVFASILLFTLATIHRYDLRWAEFGLNPDNFVAQLLASLTTSKVGRGITDDEQAILDKWIEGLYTVDDHGETNGIGDDVMRQCSPQQFYRLVPTLFAQSVLACQLEAIPMKAFKGGLELLLEPFLLPSLIMSLGWMSRHSWEQYDDADILLAALDKLLKPSSSLQETQTMHRVVLTMVATDLSGFLQYIGLKRTDARQKTTEFVDLLKPYLHQQRNLRCTKAEMKEWVAGPFKETQRAQRAVRELVDWASNSSHPPNPPPNFSYRYFAYTCLDCRHVDMVKAILTECKHNTFSTSVALDICTALFCARTSEASTTANENASRPMQRVAWLRDHFRRQAINVQDLLRRPQSEAEALVRLARRLEAQMSVPSIPPIALPIPIEEQAAAEQIIQDLGLGGLAGDVTGPDAASAAPLTGLAAPLDLSAASAEELATMAAADPGAMDIDQAQIFDGLGIDMNQVPANDPTVDALRNQEEDIFAGLDMGMDLGDDFGFS